MASFNFQTEFVPAIQSRRKVQTIRRTKRCELGGTMHLFTGLRTKSCERIADVLCVCTDYVHLAPDGLTLGNVTKHPRNIDTFAQLDGFKDFAEMLAWFHALYGAEHFIGTVHRWVWPWEAVDA